MAGNHNRSTRHIWVHRLAVSKTVASSRIARENPASWSDPIIHVSLLLRLLQGPSTRNTSACTDAVQHPSSHPASPPGCSRVVQRRTLVPASPIASSVCAGWATRPAPSSAFCDWPKIEFVNRLLFCGNAQAHPVSHSTCLGSYSPPTQLRIVRSTHGCVLASLACD